MKGFVPTPETVVDLMVDKLFRHHPPSPQSRLLDPGSGNGAFVEGVLRWCSRRKCKPPTIVAVELNPTHVNGMRKRFAQQRSVQVRHESFLKESDDRYDYIVGNPPYVAITALSEREREWYRRSYRAARGRFDLYLLFFEQALRVLKPDGRLVFITPEKFLYVETAEPLRRIMAEHTIEELHFASEETFPGLVTYPLISTIVGAPTIAATRIITRTGEETSVQLQGRAGSWLPVIRGSEPSASVSSLNDICVRISCGVATGADSIYTVRDTELSSELREYAWPTISGRQLRQHGSPVTTHSLLVPYDTTGKLLPERQLGALRRYLLEQSHHALLLARTCALRKPWYAFHETPPMRELLRPKILCKDIGSEPFFVVDRAGEIVPRHTIYYLVPKNPECIDDIADYLNTTEVREWLKDNCQRAANGFLRLQSQVLKKLPVPEGLGVTPCGAEAAIGT